MAHSITDIEDAIITALDPLKTSLGVRTVKTYQGELDEEDLKKIAINFPAIFVIYTGSDFEEVGRLVKEVPSFTLFVCDRNVRTEEEARRGGTGNPGTYAMLDGVRTIVHGQKLALDVESFQIRRQDPVWFGNGVSIYAAEYDCKQRT